MSKQIKDALLSHAIVRCVTAAKTGGVKALAMMLEEVGDVGMEADTVSALEQIADPSKPAKAAKAAKKAK